MTTAQTITRNKRERLIVAAKLAFYRQGFSTTSLADVAALAEVPLGNVYYYFRTKDNLVSAVIAAPLAGDAQTSSFTYVDKGMLAPVRRGYALAPLRRVNLHRSA